MRDRIMSCCVYCSTSEQNMRTVQVITPPRQFKPLQRHSPPSSSNYTHTLLKRKQHTQQTTKFTSINRSLNMPDSPGIDPNIKNSLPSGQSAQVEPTNTRAVSAVPKKETEQVNEFHYGRVKVRTKTPKSRKNQPNTADAENCEHLFENALLKAETPAVIHARYHMHESQGNQPGKMTLSDFYKGHPTQHSKVASTTITQLPSSQQQQLMQLKLEGTQYQVTNSHSIQTQYHRSSPRGRYASQAQTDYAKKNQKTEPVRKAIEEVSQKGDQQHLSEFKMIMSRMHIEDRETELVEKKIKLLESKRRRQTLHGNPHSQRKAERLSPKRGSREKVKVNVINVIEDSQTGKEDHSKKLSRSVYLKYLKVQGVTHEDKRISQTIENKVNPKPKDSLVDELNSIRKEIEYIQRQREQNLKRNEPVIPKNTVPCISVQEQKLNRRKSLMKNYTFNKKGEAGGSPKHRELRGHDDFEVEGWGGEEEN